MYIYLICGAPLVLQKFRTFKGMDKFVGSMTGLGLEKMIQKIKNLDPFAVQHG